MSFHRSIDLGINEVRPILEVKNLFVLIPPASANLVFTLNSSEILSCKYFGIPVFRFKKGPNTVISYHLSDIQPTNFFILGLCSGSERPFSN